MASVPKASVDRRLTYVPHGSTHPHRWPWAVPTAARLAFAAGLLKCPTAERMEKHQLVLLGAPGTTSLLGDGCSDRTPVNPLGPEQSIGVVLKQVPESLVLSTSSTSDQMPFSCLWLFRAPHFSFHMKHAFREDHLCPDNSNLPRAKQNSLWTSRVFIYIYIYIETRKT